MFPWVALAGSQRLAEALFCEWRVVLAWGKACRALRSCHSALLRCSFLLVLHSCSCVGCSYMRRICVLNASMRAPLNSSCLCARVAVLPSDALLGVVFLCNFRLCPSLRTPVLARFQPVQIFAVAGTCMYCNCICLYNRNAFFRRHPHISRVAILHSCNRPPEMGWSPKIMRSTAVSTHSLT